MLMLSFITVVILMFITPGPGVLSLAGTGAAFGWRQGLKYMAGLWIGHLLVSFAVISGLAAVILAEPIIRAVLAFLCAGNFGYLALRIAFAKSKIAFIHMAAPGFVTGVSLQFINPKAYAVHTTFFSGFVLYPDDFLFEVTIKQLSMNSIWISFHLIWLYAGVKLNELNLTSRAQNQINMGMALCLIAVVLISVWSVFSH